MPVFALIACFPFARAEPPPIMEVTADDTRIVASCRVRIPEGLVIPDVAGDGVIQVVGDGVTLEFEEGSVLRGAAAGSPGDGLGGVGVRVAGASNVTLRGLRVHGYKVNVMATDAERLVVEDADLAGAFRQRLGSTAQREDAGDWLWPHENDQNQWVGSYGAGLAIERSSNVTVRRVRVRESQNGIILDEVGDSDVYDNDCSFLSGWGLAMWRSSRNTVTRNAFDFCIRGHEEGVYNRGQDSAGILMFEQCRDNIVADNSATHGGDGIFAFGGREAIGESAPREGAEIDYADAGCNDNVFLRNDLSFCSAHGYEMTFSENNVFARNRVVGNGICGVWGGYSSGSVYAENYFARNGALAYGRERGGINIEHGSDNLILDNTFENNRIGVRLWWDDDGRLLALPGVKASYRGVAGNVVAGNTFIMTAAHPFALRDGERLVGVQHESFGGDGAFGVNPIGSNTFQIDEGVGERIELGPGVGEATAPASRPRARIPAVGALGDTTPVGARVRLGGREAIVMGEWGPWDHEGVFVRRTESSGPRHAYEIRGVPEAPVTLECDEPGGLLLETGEARGGVAHVALSAPGPGVYPYDAWIVHAGGRERVSGRLVRADWSTRVWGWKADPLVDAQAWRREADAAPPVTLGALDLAFAMDGPGGVAPMLAGSEAGADRFGVIATASIPLNAGVWRVRTLSDDGVRVVVDGKTLIERWDIHGPTPDEGVFTLDEARGVEIVVEYFENDGYATLRVDIEPAD